MTGHGYVVPNADGSKARCGGPTICADCALEYARLHVQTRKCGKPATMAIWLSQGPPFYFCDACLGLSSRVLGAAHTGPQSLAVAAAGRQCEAVVVLDLTLADSSA